MLDLGVEAADVSGRYPNFTWQIQENALLLQPYTLYEGATVMPTLSHHCDCEKKTTSKLSRSEVRIVSRPVRGGERRGETTFRKDLAFWEDRGRRRDSIKSLNDLLSVLSRQVLTVNTSLISLCIFMTFFLLIHSLLMSELPHMASL